MPPKIVKPGPTASWTPKYPEASTRGPDGGDVPVGLGDENLSWMRAPATSHLDSFHFSDGNNGFNRRFLGGKSCILIRFRATATQPMTQYSYTFSDRQEALRIFNLLATAPHPGEVVDAELIKKRVPYERTAVGEKPTG
jgi:hypothetical protein